MHDEYCETMFLTIYHICDDEINKKSDRSAWHGCALAPEKCVYAVFLKQTGLGSEEIV